MDNITLALIKAIAGNSGGGTVTPGKDGVGISKIEKTDTQGLVDTYTISYTNGTTTTFTVTNGQNGQDGEDGANGSPGKDGQNGITPTIGENGNWYLGDEDTGKPSRGEKGDKGDTGNTGPAGADGTPGTNGQDGSPGEDGFSPTIVENENNDESTYKLDITTKTGSFTTPNLKSSGASSGTGTTDYSDLSNKPKINNVEVDGELTSSDLGLIDVNQGSDNAFKYMRVNAQGKVEPYTIQNSDTPSRVYIFDTTSKLSDIYNFMTDPNWDFGVFKEQEADGENRYVKYIVSSATKRTVEDSDVYTIICYPVIDKTEFGSETFKIMVASGGGSSAIGSCREFREIAFQQKTDNTLNTTDKTIVGAINELLAKINTLIPAEGEALLTVPTGSSE